MRIQNRVNIEELDYHLPAQLIAQHGLADRARSRLMVLDRQHPDGDVQHRVFADLVDFLAAGDCLVLNDSRVIPARFFLRRPTGGRLEGLFLAAPRLDHWQVLLKGAGRVQIGEPLALLEGAQPDAAETGIVLRPIERGPRGQWLLAAGDHADFLDVLDRYGATPLPPYIHRQPAGDVEDRARYQTVYARRPGSVAAPTAGLHFTEELLAVLAEAGIRFARVTLHVGLGTFTPIETRRVEDHHMHTERYEVTPAAAAAVNATLDRGDRVVAVGTTSVRTLESAARNGRVQPGAAPTDLFITPGYRFQVVSALLTNFHLPRTSLLALVCAFAGTARTLAAYRQAIQNEYRFYSYGDAMLVL